MDDEDRELLQQVAAQVKQNNAILRSLQRAHRWNTAWKIFYWVLICTFAVVVYFGLQPYLHAIMDMAARLGIFSTQAAESAGKINNLLNNI